MRRWLAVALVLALAGVAGLGRGDAARADASWTWAAEQAGPELAAPPYTDAARDAAKVRPWQEGYGVARQRALAVGRARRATLGHAGGVEP